MNQFNVHLPYAMFHVSRSSGTVFAKCLRWNWQTQKRNRQKKRHSHTHFVYRTCQAMKTPKEMKWNEKNRKSLAIKYTLWCVFVSICVFFYTIFRVFSCIHQFRCYTHTHHTHTAIYEKGKLKLIPLVYHSAFGMCVVFRIPKDSFYQISVVDVLLLKILLDANRRLSIPFSHPPAHSSDPYLSFKPFRSEKIWYLTTYLVHRLKWKRSHNMGSNAMDFVYEAHTGIRINKE